MNIVSSLQSPVFSPELQLTGDQRPATSDHFDRRSK